MKNKKENTELSLIRDEVAFLEQYFGIKLFWYQKIILKYMYRRSNAKTRCK